MKVRQMKLLDIEPLCRLGGAGERVPSSSYCWGESLQAKSRAQRGISSTMMSGLKLVGATGFEPVTPCAQGRCATRLRYAPTE
jgi:hypothetical protein